MNEPGSILADALRIVHIVTAVLLAWPFYALVLVNQRARLGPPLGDRADLLLENVIKNRTVPCFVFQATMLVTGLGLLLVDGSGLGALVSVPSLGLKFLLLLYIAAVLAYVYVRVQPAIDAGFAVAGDGQISADVAAKVARLRLVRKRLASTCLFAVLTAVVLGVQVAASVPAWLAGLAVVATALFVIRAYKTVTPYGWI